jgi:hypothetical protein
LERITRAAPNKIYTYFKFKSEVSQELSRCGNRQYHQPHPAARAASTSVFSKISEKRVLGSDDYNKILKLIRRSRKYHTVVLFS